MTARHIKVTLKDGTVSTVDESVLPDIISRILELGAKITPVEDTLTPIVPTTFGYPDMPIGTRLISYPHENTCIEYRGITKRSPKLAFITVGMYVEGAILKGVEVGNGKILFDDPRIGQQKHNKHRYISAETIAAKWRIIESGAKEVPVAERLPELPHGTIISRTLPDEIYAGIVMDDSDDVDTWVNAPDVESLLRLGAPKIIQGPDGMRLRIRSFDTRIGGTPLTFNAKLNHQKTDTEHPNVRDFDTVYDKKGELRIEKSYTVKNGDLVHIYMANRNRPRYDQNETETFYEVVNGKLMPIPEPTYRVKVRELKDMNLFLRTN